MGDGQLDRCMQLMHEISDSSFVDVRVTHDMLATKPCMLGLSQHGHQTLNPYASCHCRRLREAGGLADGP